MTDPMPTDFRALCAELVDCLEKANWPLRHKTLFEICLAEARTALAQPEPVAPTTPSEWHLLSLEQPSLNALCEYTCHANNWEVIQGKGKWHEQTNPTVSGFTNSHGLFVSDPTQTLWRLAQPEPQGLVPEVDDILRLAAIIREVDGNNDKGATALAEAILSHSDSRWQHAKIGRAHV